MRRPLVYIQQRRFGAARLINEDEWGGAAHELYRLYCERLEARSHGARGRSASARAAAEAVEVSPRSIERFGYVRMTIFGDLWEFRSDGGFDDTASTPLEITPHTDGSYSNDAPGLLALHCHRYDARGGENVFCAASNGEDSSEVA